MNDPTDVYGVLFACPAGKRLKVCPFHLIDHFTFKEKVLWFDGLSGEEQESMINHHIEGSKKRGSK